MTCVFAVDTQFNYERLDLNGKKNFVLIAAGDYNALGTLIDATLSSRVRAGEDFLIDRPTSL